MPHTRSAAKNLRQSIKRATANKALRSSMRTFEKKVLEAIESGKKAEAEALLPVAYQQFDKAARHGILHANTAANHKRRLARKIGNLP